MLPLSIDSSVNAFASSPFGWLAMTVIYLIFVFVIPPMVIFVFWLQFITSATRWGAALFTSIYLASLAASIWLTAALPHVIRQTAIASVLQAIMYILAGMTLVAAGYLDVLVLMERYDAMIAPLRPQFPHRESFEAIPREAVHKPVTLLPEVEPTEHIRRTPATDAEYLDVSSNPITIPVLIEPVHSAPVAPSLPPPIVHRGRHAA